MTTTETIITRKCDFCGETVNKFITSTSEGYPTFVEVIFHLQRWYANNLHMDLCHDCNQKIIDWIQANSYNHELNGQEK